MTLNLQRGSQGSATTPEMNAIQQGTFRALSDPTRRQILMHLSHSDLTIGEVSAQFEITRGAVKKHLTILEEGRLISVHPKGRERINRLEPQALKSVAEWLDYFSQFWDAKLSKLQRAVESHQQSQSDKDSNNE